MEKGDFNRILNGNKVLVIAEAGVNHNGDIQRAFDLVNAAKAAGADVVKFQTFSADKLTTRSAELANYQKLSGESGVQVDMLKKLELSQEQHGQLLKHCKQIGIEFLSTAFDFDSVDFLKTLNLGLWKIPSGEITNWPYLVKIAKFNEPTILSTGMSTMSEVEVAVKTLFDSGLAKENLCVLHCNTQYPTPISDMNLNAIVTLKAQLQTAVGLSDHSFGIDCAIAAVALGAIVIEKHLTLDRSLPGPDHKASLEPEEFQLMVNGIRAISTALGNGEKVPTPSEKENLHIARKSIVAKTLVRTGEVWSPENLTTKRPCSGLSPMLWPKLLGRKARRDYLIDELIDAEELG